MKQYVTLEFDKIFTDLAGFDYGNNVFKSQIEKQVNWEELSVLSIKFPDNIHDVAISFVQGLYSGLIEKMGYDSAMDNVEIDSVNERLKERIKKCI